MKYNECSKCYKVVIPFLFVGNTILAITKVIIGIIGNSTGLIADGAHSATDAFSALILWFGMKFTERPADESHPYGHRNFEYILAKVISVFLMLVGFYILFTAIYKMYKGDIVTPDYITLVTALMSIVANALMSGYGKCVGTQANSPAILSAAFEIHADMMSSIAIAIGIIGAELGYPILDPIAAAVVAILIIRNSIHMLMDAINGLMDGAIDQRVKRRIVNIVKRNPEVLGMEFLRTRQMGSKITIETGIKVASHMTVIEGESIMRDIRADLINLVENVEEVEISITSESDDMVSDYKSEFDLALGEV